MKPLMMSFIFLILIGLLTNFLFNILFKCEISTRPPKELIKEVKPLAHAKMEIRPRFGWIKSNNVY